MEAEEPEEMAACEVDELEIKCHIFQSSDQHLAANNPPVQEEEEVACYSLWAEQVVEQLSSQEQRVGQQV